MPLPNFLIIGFPRCGTTFLTKSLNKHDDIYLPKKEINFFGNPSKRIEDYLSLFRNDNVNGEKTPNYILRAKSMIEIANSLQNIKLLVCVRHPIQALHSFYDQRVRLYNLGKPNGINPNSIAFTDIINNHLIINDVAVHNYNYIKFIEQNVLSHFDKSNLKIIVNEKLRSNTDQVLNEIFDFLTVKSQKVSFDSIQHYDNQLQYDNINYDSTSYKESLNKLFEYYSPTIEKLYDYLGYRIDSWYDIENLYKRYL